MGPDCGIYMITDLLFDYYSVMSLDQRGSDGLTSDKVP